MSLELRGSPHPQKRMVFLQSLHKEIPQSGWEATKLARVRATSCTGGFQSNGSGRVDLQQPLGKRCVYGVGGGLLAGKPKPTSCLLCSHSFHLLPAHRAMGPLIQARVTSCIICMAQSSQERLSSPVQARNPARWPAQGPQFSSLMPRQMGGHKALGHLVTGMERDPNHPACTGGLRDPLVAHSLSPPALPSRRPRHVRLKAKRTPSL